MRSSAVSTVTLLLTLGLTACAGTPPAGEQASARQNAKCERATGSMLCGSADDQPYGSLSAPNTNQRRSGPNPH